MPPRRGRGRRGAVEPEYRVDHIERILEELVQVVHDIHNNNNHDDAPQQPAMPMLGAGVMPRTTIKQFQQLKPPTFYGTPNPMAVESWLLGIEMVFEVLPWTDEQKSSKKRSGGDPSRGQSSKRQSSGSSSENLSTLRENIVDQRSNMSNEVPTCPNCRRKHWGECRFGSKVCYKCGQEGHQAKDCLRWNRAQGTRMSASASTQQPPVARRDNQSRQGRAFALIPKNTPANTSKRPGCPTERAVKAIATKRGQPHTTRFAIKNQSSTTEA
ncbi:hypothetical protein Acr_00g0053670 [Actinidia rufa]|uniref:CCHC-type domain-containing protein n=1 Tax=Actinidia rufa TaxID=165716 RepID=A0A7J0DLL1_9ERIC|nr:hypothetical protein Acr_00g0053670 [Actinidia rufa]